MLFDIPAMIQAGANAFGKFFGMKEASIEHQLETNILHDNDNYIEAIGFAENIIDLFEDSNQNIEKAGNIINNNYGYLSDENLKELRDIEKLLQNNENTLIKLKKKFNEHKRG